jgi:hypothetical protein
MKIMLIKLTQMMIIITSKNLIIICNQIFQHLNNNHKVNLSIKSTKIIIRK